MPKFFATENQLQNETIIIKGQDVNHIKNVLRKKVGDVIPICIPEFLRDYTTEIQNITENEIECKIIESKESVNEEKIQVTIFQGLPKSDKMELVIQKSVELGVYDIYPVDMKRCIVKLKDQDKKIERWQKISEVASKQCSRGIIPKINNVINIQEICYKIKEYDVMILAYEQEEVNTLKQELQKINKNQASVKIGVIIGPEGGIDFQEVEKLKENGAKIITLGNRILRTETVAFNVLSCIMYELN